MEKLLDQYRLKDLQHFMFLLDRAESTGISVQLLKSKIDRRIHKVRKETSVRPTLKYKHIRLNNKNHKDAQRRLLEVEQIKCLNCKTTLRILPVNVSKETYIESDPLLRSVGVCMNKECSETYFSYKFAGEWTVNTPSDVMKDSKNNKR